MIQKTRGEGIVAPHDFKRVQFTEFYANHYASARWEQYEQVKVKTSRTSIQAAMRQVCGTTYFVTS